MGCVETYGKRPKCPLLIPHFQFPLRQDPSEENNNNNNNSDCSNEYILQTCNGDEMLTIN